MKLFLSSQDFGNHLERLHDMLGVDKRALVICNAGDYASPDERAARIEEKRREFTEAGFEFYELDLRNYFRSPDKLKPIIDAAPFVWATGGNTFLLRKAFEYSGLDSLLNNALKNTNMVYGGSSAGSIVMTKTLRGSEHGDDPYMVPDGYDEEILWDGLGLVYPQLVPHYRTDWFGQAADAMADYFESNGLKYETLQDGEVYIVDGKYEEKLT